MQSLHYEYLTIPLRHISIIQIEGAKKQGVFRMEQNTKVLILFQTTLSLWVISLVFMVLAWAWMLFYNQEPPRIKRPSLNLKEL